MRFGDGNGHPEFRITQQDMGGWVRGFLDDPRRVPDNAAVYLSHALAQWFRERPQLRMRFAVPIDREGNTVELHAWYDAVQFPDVSPLAPKPD
jgi:hypothetical protein